MRHDDHGADWQQYEQDRPIVEFLDAVDTVAAFVGGDEGERVKRALLDLAHLPEPVPPEQQPLPFFDGASVPY